MASVADETKVGHFREVIRIDEDQFKEHVADVVRQSVEETLNGLLEAEVNGICGATRYERSPERLDTRAGHYKRTLLTQAGEVELRVPRLQKLPFKTQIIERYRRRESSVEEELLETRNPRNLRTYDPFPQLAMQQAA
jgi:putative transposase